MATDEAILARTLGTGLTRDGYGHLEQPEVLYRPYTIRSGGGEVACLFRDHVLSDLIGFTYASWYPTAAADDFVGRLVEAGRRFSARTGGAEAVVPIILDGENAWEHYEGQGRPFLRALYRRAGHASRAADRHDGARRAQRGDDSAERRSFPGRGSTATSTSGSATPTITGPGASWPTRGRRSRRPGPRPRRGRHRPGA